MSLSWRAIRRGGLASLLLILIGMESATATTISNINVVWRTQPDPTTQSRIESSLNFARGSVVTETRLTRILESTLSRLAALGHHRAVVEPQDFQYKNDTLSFNLAIDPGPVVLISKWELAGLRRTDSLWLIAALDLPTGIPASDEVISDAVSRLSAFGTISLGGAPEFVLNSDDGVSVVLPLHEQSPARLEGALVAGSANGADQALLGRFSLGLNGLFRRGHALDIQYEHPQPSERLLRLGYSEQYALWRNLASHFRFEDWRRDDHRQQIGTDVTICLSRRRDVDLLVGANWQKVAPLASSTSPSRLYESTAGVKLGDAQSAGIMLSGTYSLHRQWQRASGIEESRSRVRLESQGGGTLGLGPQSRIRLSYGGRLWGNREILRAGDEWFLGGEVLSGYSARSIAAAEGAWSRLEISRRFSSGLGVSVFGDQAWLSLFDGSYARPATLGLALLLDSPGRSSRLELAWKDRATFRDGILRLSVVQDW